MGDILKGILGCALVVGFVILTDLSIREYDRYRKKCTDNGGHWEKYNCHQVSDWNCDYYTDANGYMQLMGCHTDYRTECDEHCVGASAEAQP